jgi:hypothetical protein
MKTGQTSIKQGVCHIVALPFTLKSILKQIIKELKNYENSNISSCKSSKKSSKRNQNSSRYHNSITILKFQHKQKYHLSKILILKIDLLLRGQNP